MTIRRKVIALSWLRRGLLAETARLARTAPGSSNAVAGVRQTTVWSCRASRPNAGRGLPFFREPDYVDRRRVSAPSCMTCISARNANLFTLAVRHPSYHQGRCISRIVRCKQARPHVAGTEERGSRSGERNQFLALAKLCRNRRLILSRSKCTFHRRVRHAFVARRMVIRFNRAI
jgi:hypothetical protein